VTLGFPWQWRTLGREQARYLAKAAKVGAVPVATALFGAALKAPARRTARASWASPWVVCDLI
jgi:hypothetical protein